MATTLQKGVTISNKFNKRQGMILIGAICALIVMLARIGANADEASEANAKIERVALFKNGLGYFISSAILPEESTTITINQLPVPTHGTFWVGYPEDVKVHSLVTSLENSGKTVSARNVAELLLCNIGRRVTISTNIIDMPAVKGTVAGVTQEDTQAESPTPYYMDPRRSTYPSRNLPSQGVSLVIIKTNSGNVALNAGSIIRANFEGDDIATSVPAKSQQPSMRIELEKAAKGQKIGISYLAKGITWSPSYLIDISDSKTAKLTAKAVVINEAADLQEIHLDLVTGYPNIRFADVNSPVAMSQDLAGFLKALTGGKSDVNPLAGNIMTTQTALAYFSDGYNVSSPIPAPTYSTAQEGTVSEDLFLYPVESFTLNRGETACLPLFTAEVPYKHIYIWKIPDMIDENERYRRDIAKDKQAFAEEVWHSCRLINNMEMPWTTAAAEFVTEGQFTGQDICYYTPAGGETTIRLNRALNILAEQSELELVRQRNAASFYGYSHDLVKVKGEMKLVNRLNKSVTVEVTKDLSGDVLEIIPQAKNTQTAKGLKMVSTRHVLMWEIELKPGQEQKLSYTYQVYIRN